MKITSPAWMADAACIGLDPEAFFPETTDDSQYVRRVCQRCRVRPECADWAIAIPDQLGIAGGLTARQRKDIRNGHEEAAA